MIKMVATLIAAAISSATMAESILWQNVPKGMAYSDVQTLYPASAGVVHKPASIGLKHFQITEKCEGRVNIRFEKGSVVSVDIEAPLGYKAWKNDTDCDRIILNALTRKYGDPNRSLREVTPGPLIDTKEKKYVWVTEQGTDIRLELSNMDPQFTITYTAASTDSAL